MTAGIPATPKEPLEHKMGEFSLPSFEDLIKDYKQNFNLEQLNAWSMAIQKRFADFTGSEKELEETLNKNKVSADTIRNILTQFKIYKQNSKMSAEKDRATNLSTKAEEITQQEKYLINHPDCHLNAGTRTLKNGDVPEGSWLITARDNKLFVCQLINNHVYEKPVRIENNILMVGEEKRLFQKNEDIIPTLMEINKGMFIKPSTPLSLRTDIFKSKYGDKD